MNSALLLIDIQNDYFPGGRCELFGAERAAAQAGRALALFRAAGRPVFHIRHISLAPDAGFFLPDTQGSEIHASVSPREGEKVIVKHAPNAFLGTELLDALRARAIGRLTVCGMMTHMCIDTSVRAGNDLGFKIVLAGDACATKSLVWGQKVVSARTVHRVILASLQGTFAQVVKVRELSKDPIG